MSKEAMKLALEALEWINRVNAMDFEYQRKARESLNAIYEALAEQPAQTDWEAVAADQAMTIALLRAEQPAQRTWVGLTHDEIYSVLENLQVMHHRPPTTDSRVIFALAIEAKLKEKNT